MIIPTQRSVQARQHNNSFDGGWRDDTFWRATMAQTFPKSAIRARILCADEYAMAWGVPQNFVMHPKLSDTFIIFLFLSELVVRRVKCSLSLSPSVGISTIVVTVLQTGNNKFGLVVLSGSYIVIICKEIAFRWSCHMYLSCSVNRLISVGLFWENL